ncbi:transposase family protein [Streptomyces sp. NBC_01450]|uniref:transposase family protein n=1 Tax=Streptomyces sp. NBC_01450 TaxID=2903871 RepID=UPI003FCC9469
MLITLVCLRPQLPHAALAELYGVTRPTVTRAIHEISPLLAGRGFAVPQRPGARLHTLADVFACAEAEGVDLRVDGTEVQVRRPRADRPGRMHDRTAVRTEGIAEQLRLHPKVKAEADEGYRGLAYESFDQVSAVPAGARSYLAIGQWARTARQDALTRLGIHPRGPLGIRRPPRRPSPSYRATTDRSSAIAAVTTARSAAVASSHL